MVLQFVGTAPQAFIDAVRPLVDFADPDHAVIVAIEDGSLPTDKWWTSSAAAPRPTSAAESTETGAAATVYAVRYIFMDGFSTPKLAGQDLTTQLRRRTHDGRVRFVSTRGGAPDVSFLTAIRDGLAPDGGLYMPTTAPEPFPKALLHLLLAGSLSYIEAAQLVLERLVDPIEVPPQVLRRMIEKAYDASRWSDAAICPVRLISHAAVTPEAHAEGAVFLSEQFHGPTAAFKDFALQLFPQLFALSTANRDETYCILTATSGDTGVAAINGFQYSAPAVKVMVLFPAHGVSPVQRAQMLACHDGKKINVVAVDSDFDFCQNTVKHIFNDGELAARLHAKGVCLSSANSINWGRLLPQIVYYIYSYGQLVAGGAIRPGEAIDVAVPTGNFGNILAAFYAKRFLGLPIGRLILASNANDVLVDFVTTGVYDLTDRRLALTASPSIDILKASNVERFLFLATGGDHVATRAMMKSLDGPARRFEVPPAVKELLQATFVAGRCSEAECRATILEVSQSAPGNALLDPHTAVAVHVAKRHRRHGTTVLVASTAHWAKFPAAVAEALVGGAAVEGLGVTQLYAAVAAAVPSAVVAAPLAKIFSAAEQPAAPVADGAAAESRGEQCPADVTLLVERLVAFTQ